MAWYNWLFGILGFWIFSYIIIRLIVNFKKKSNENPYASKYYGY